MCSGKWLNIMFSLCTDYIDALGLIIPTSSKILSHQMSAFDPLSHWRKVFKIISLDFHFKIKQKEKLKTEK